MIPLSCCGKFGAVGVVRFSVSAKVAEGDCATSAVRAVALQSVKPAKKPKKNTGRQKKAKKLIGRLKTAVGWD